MKLAHETFNLPDSYYGKNQHLEDVLDFMIRKEDEFYTQRLLPWQHTDQLHVQWDIFTFNRSIMDVEPEQGIPRLVTSEMDTKSDNLLRRGLAFIIEHGFMTTERGRRTFMLNLQQITDAVHTTAYHGVMTALLETEDKYVDKKEKHIRLFQKTDRARWACVQKSHKGLYVLDAELKYDMARKQVVPNTWVFPPKMSIYLDMAPPEETQYRLKGPLAAGNLEEDRTNKGISWRGTSVFESQPFDVEFTDEPEDLLSQQRQCGEYFHFKPDVLDRANPKDACIQIYNAESDTFEEISLADCHMHDLLQAPLYWKREEKSGEDEADGKREMFDSGSIRWLDGPSNGYVTDNLDRLLDGLDGFNEGVQNYIETLLTGRSEAGDANSVWDRLVEAGEVELATVGQEISKDLFVCVKSNKKISETELTRIIDKVARKSKQKTKKESDAQVLLITELVHEVYGIHYQILYGVLQKIADLNYRDVDMDYLIFRPFQTYRMSSALLAAGGTELGSTFHGHHDFQLSDDIIRKVHVGHYTHYSKSVVKQPKRFTVARHVYAQAYIRGESTTFYSINSLRADLQEQELGESASLLVFSIRSPARPLIHAISITGKPNDEIIDGTIPHEIRTIHSRISEQFDGVLRGRLQEVLVPENISTGFDTDEIHFNGDCFPGAVLDKWGTCIQKNMGHWGDLTYAGCMRVREGEIMHIEKEKILQPGTKYVHVARI